MPLKLHSDEGYFIGPQRHWSYGTIASGRVFANFR